MIFEMVSLRNTNLKIIGHVCGTVCYYTTVNEYSRMVVFIKDLDIQVDNVVSVYEKYYKSKGRSRWMARAIRMATHVILASDTGQAR